MMYKEIIRYVIKHRMMVKNEEKYLDKCLNALKSILENLNAELIVVDTGSTDNTVEIAKKYTNKVYFHQWNNNFF